MRLADLAIAAQAKAVVERSRLVSLTGLLLGSWSEQPFSRTELEEFIRTGQLEKAKLVPDDGDDPEVVEYIEAIEKAGRFVMPEEVFGYGGQQ